MEGNVKMITGKVPMDHTTAGSRHLNHKQVVPYVGFSSDQKWAESVRLSGQPPTCQRKVVSGQAPGTQSVYVVVVSFIATATPTDGEF